jgi:hypothetical protein
VYTSPSLSNHERSSSLIAGNVGNKHYFVYKVPTTKNIYPRIWRNNQNAEIIWLTQENRVTSAISLSQSSGQKSINPRIWRNNQNAEIIWLTQENRVTSAISLSQHHELKKE